MTWIHPLLNRVTPPQVVAWCTDSVPFPNLVFVDALGGTKNAVFCHDGLVRHATFAKVGAWGRAGRSGLGRFCLKPLHNHQS